MMAVVDSIFVINYILKKFAHVEAQMAPAKKAIFEADYKIGIVDFGSVYTSFNAKIEPLRK